jgi:hypothetical protein
MNPSKRLEYSGNKKGQVKWVSNVDYIVKLACMGTNEIPFEYWRWLWF